MTAIPPGYDARFDLSGAPLWLRLLHDLPLLDRLAVPHLLARGRGFLVPHPATLRAELDVIPAGWRLSSPAYMRPDASAELRD